MERNQTIVDELDTEEIAVRAATLAPRRYTSDARSFLLFAGIFLVALVVSLVWTAEVDWVRVAFILVCASPLLVLLGAWMLYSYKIVEVDAAGFHVRDLWGTKSELPWEQVAAVQGVGGASGFVLTEKVSDTRVPLVDASGGEELLALVRHVRPDLWRRFDASELTNGENKGRNLFFDWRVVVFGLLWTINGVLDENFVLAAFFLALGVIALWGLLTDVVSIRLEPDGLRMRRRWGQRTVPRADVADFVRRKRGGGVQLVRRDGSMVNLGRMEGGTEYMLEVLRAWLTG